MARMHEGRESSTARRSPRAATPNPRSGASGAHHKLLQDYQNALQFLGDGKFEKARVLLEKIVPDAPPEILERVKLYLVVCERNTRLSDLKFGNPEEQYDYAVSLLNAGSFEDARDQFEAILSKSPGADFAHYGMALLNSMTGQAEEALDHLGRAIQLNPANRIQARSDPDFLDMADDPRFTELLYPESI
jgi:tetratricopeptide (TPR) repeat protein